MKFSIKDFFSKCDQIRSFPTYEEPARSLDTMTSFEKLKKPPCKNASFHKAIRLHTYIKLFPMEERVSSSFYFQRSVFRPVRGVFRTHSNIFDGAFLRKMLTAKAGKYVSEATL